MIPFAALLAKGPVPAASRWMILATHGNGTAAAFPLSDHADWSSRNTAIQATGASKVITMHGHSKPFADWLTAEGPDARPLA